MLTKSKLKASKSLRPSTSCGSLLCLTGAAMLGVLLILSLSSLVALVPPPPAPPALCKSCCDHLEPAEGSGAQPITEGFNHVPEVRTYINMTILKGIPTLLLSPAAVDISHTGFMHIKPN